MKEQNGINNTKKMKSNLISVGLAGTILLGGVVTVQNDKVDADTLKVVYEVDGEKNEGNIPVINYLVVGGEPQDFTYKSDKEGKISYFVNTEDKTLVKGLEDRNITTKGFTKDAKNKVATVKEGSILDLGNIGVKGEFKRSSEDLLGLKGDNISEYLFEVKDGSYKKLGDFKTVTEKEVEGKNLAVVVFVEEEEKEVKEEPKKEAKKEGTLATETVGDVIDTSKEKGKLTYLGDTLDVKVDETGKGFLFISKDLQIKALDFIQENEKKKYTLETHPIYKELGIKSAQDLYNKLGIYNISKDIKWLYLEELDTNKNGVMGEVKGKPVVSYTKVDPKKKSVTPEWNGATNPDYEDVELKKGDIWDNTGESKEPEDKDYEGGVITEGEDEIVDIGGITKNPPKTEGSGKGLENIDISDLDKTEIDLGNDSKVDGGNTETDLDKEEDTDLSGTIVRDGDTYEFDSKGNLIKVVDEYGNVVAELLDGKLEYKDENFKNKVKGLDKDGKVTVEDGKVMLADTGIAEEKERGVLIGGITAIVMGIVVLFTSGTLSKRVRRKQ